MLEPDEGRYAECAREMLASGNWLLPQLHGKLHITKPPMTYWAIMGGILTFGKNEWGVRFYLVAAFGCTVLLLRSLGTMMWGKKIGNLTGWIYLTTLLPFFSANLVNADSLLVFWEVFAVWTFWQGISTDSLWKRYGVFFLMWVLFGCAFLTKGPPGLMPLPAILVYAYLYKSANRDRIIFQPFWISSIGIAAGFWWYLYVCWITPNSTGYFWEDEIIGRLFTGIHHRNSTWIGIINVYLPTLVLGFLPWSCCWILFRPTRKRFCVTRSELWNWLHQNKQSAFLITWFFISLLLFCISSSRLPMYLLPLSAPFALATARFLESSGRYAFHPIRNDPSYDSSRKWKWGLVLWIGILLFSKWGLAQSSGGFNRKNFDARKVFFALQERKVINDFWDIYLITEVPIHGLTFYSQKKITYIGVDFFNYKNWYEGTLDPVLDRISKDSHSAFLLCDHDKRGKIYQKLKKYPLVFKMYPLVYGFEVFEVYPNPSHQILSTLPAFPE